jgi:nicotinate-nucleotide--dimethylbenzimidazole phosphoribosyltransferase
MRDLSRFRDAIRPPSPLDRAAALRRLDLLTKPRGSLGRLEELACRLVEIGRGTPAPIDRPVIFTLAADHGVVAEGVSAYPQAVTRQMIRNFLAGGAAVNVLARQAGARVVVADFGVATAVAAADGLVQRRIGSGTRNLAREAAMTRAEAIEAVEAGAALAEGEIQAGADLVGTGEMGIGNTTSASAVTAVITGASPDLVTGPGTGVDATTLRRKIEIVRRALDTSRPDPTDGLDVLAKLGGFELGGLVGVVLAGAARGVPVVLDGFVATAAGLLAAALAPACRPFLLAAHRSPEPGHGIALAHLGLEPYLDLGMRLGEGTGVALFVHLARAAARIYTDMATFDAAGVAGPR